MDQPMPTYVYTGRNGAGVPVRGVMTAESEAAATALLREQGLFITSLRPRTRWALAGRRRRQPGLEEVAAFTYHLAGLASSGIPLLRGLEVAREQEEDGTLRDIIADLRDSIEAGQSMSAAMSRHPKVFSPAYIGVVRSGEVGGVLDQALLRLTDYLDREVALRQKISSMTVYPAFVLVLAAVVVAIFGIFVIPAFEKIYRSAGAPLPLPTAVLVEFSRLLREYWMVGLIAAAAAAWILVQTGTWTRLGAAGVRLLCRIPRVGTVVHLVQVNRFLRTFSATYASGVPVMLALDITAGSVSEPEVAAAANYLKEKISSGQRLSEAMRAVALFPPMVHRMTAMGEETGRLDELLRRICDLLDREIDFSTKRLVTMAEPLLTLALGGVIALILLALYLPIFGLPRAILR